MNKQDLNEDNLNRLALGIMQKNGCSYDEAIGILTSLRLYVRCGDKIRNSQSLQAALLTVVNTGKRAFLGGVYVAMPADVKFVIQWPFSTSLNEAVNNLGADIVSNDEIGQNLCIHLGLPASIDNNSIEIVSSGWIGGICNGVNDFYPSDNVDFALGGIAGAALAVSSVFMRQTNINPFACDRSCGISLWRPDLDWRDSEANGPEIKYLPKKIWLLGLGHLGQAYAWCLGLLPFKNPEEFNLLIQDYDKITEANFSAGLLSEALFETNYKTRRCASWLESFGFQVKITERAYDLNTKRVDDEPYVALCGFDSAKSRMLLEKSGFDLIVESAIGSDLSDFDMVITHTFPNPNSEAEELWRDAENRVVNSVLIEALEKEVKKRSCGILVADLASKAMSASFVGAFSGALVVGEILRGINGGIKTESIVVRIRSVKDRRTSVVGDYDVEHGQNGTTLSNN